MPESCCSQLYCNVTMQLDCADAANVNMQMQAQAVRKRKGGREEWGHKFYQVNREEEGCRKKEQVMVEQDAEQTLHKFSPILILQGKRPPHAEDAKEKLHNGASADPVGLAQYSAQTLIRVPTGARRQP